MAEFIIRCIADGSGLPTPYDEMYLKRYEPEAHDGMGLAEWTPHLSEAVKFASPVDARIAWMTIPQTRTIRDDGKPNRPLTAFSVSIERVRDDQPI